MRIVELSRSTSAPVTFLLLGQSSPFFRQRGSDGGQLSFFPVVDLLIRSGNTGNQTLKLSKIARTVDFGWVNICVYNFFVGRPKITKFFRSNTDGVAGNQVCFPLLMSWSLLEIFATKL